MVSEATIAHVLFLIAMEAEAGPFIAHLALQPRSLSHPWAPCLVYTGSYKGCTVTVVTNGKDVSGVDNVGTTPAALSSFLAITELSPDLVINAGTAGGFRAKGAAIGDTFISSSFCHHDRRIPIPGWDAYAKGNHASLSCVNLVGALGYKMGVVTTGNSLDHTEMDDKLMLENDASVKDMEAAAVAWVAMHADKPFFAIKVVTDIVDGDRVTHEEFMENLGTAATSLQKALPQVVEFVVGKRVADL